MRIRRFRSFTVSTEGGHSLKLDDASGQVELRHSSGSVIAIDASGQVTITAGTRVTLTAPTVDVHAAVIAADGIIECTTLIASAGVVSPSYSPGVGNVW